MQNRQEFISKLFHSFRWLQYFNKKPKKLYKYRIWSNEYHRRALINNEIYFTSPSKLNDPYDCKIPLNFKLGRRKKHIQVALKTLKFKHPELSGEKRKQIVSERIEQIFNDPTEFIKSSTIKMNKKWDKDAGIYALSSIPDNIVMWSHYCNEHKGFVIGYDFKKLKDCRLMAEYCKDNILFDLFKVKYVKKIPYFNPIRIDNPNVLIELLRTKSIQWKYENEYRLILISGTDISIQVPPDIITEVILGYKMDKKDREEIISIIRSKSNKTRIFESILREDKFGLIFNEISV